MTCRTNLVSLSCPPVAYKGTLSRERARGLSRGGPWSQDPRHPTEHRRHLLLPFWKCPLGSLKQRPWILSQVRRSQVKDVGAGSASWAQGESLSQHEHRQHRGQQSPGLRASACRLSWPGASWAGRCYSYLAGESNVEVPGRGAGAPGSSWRAL